MTVFLRCVKRSDRENCLRDMVRGFRHGHRQDDVFVRDVAAFSPLEGTPFPYWVTANILALHDKFSALEPSHGEVRVGAQTDDDPRFVRLWWEVSSAKLGVEFPGIIKGDRSEKYYGEVFTVVNWRYGGKEIKEAVSRSGSHWSRRLSSYEIYGQPGISWSTRTSCLSPVLVPQGCIPTVSRYIIPNNGPHTFALAGILSSAVADLLCKLRMDRIEHPKFIVGAVKGIPIPEIPDAESASLSSKIHDAWLGARVLISVQETSHAFVLPSAMRARLGNYDPPGIEADLAKTQAEIDEIAFNLYGFSEADRAAVLGVSGSTSEHPELDIDDDEHNEEVTYRVDRLDGLLSWCVGVAFGRFDWRLATGEREAPPEPDPFDPLPAKSPGMLPNGTVPFHVQSGILAEDQGQPHDLPRLIEEVLSRVQADLPGDVRRWLQRDFFALHLKQYSKSRRKAPIYWPISTSSGSYTLWLYYPSLTSETLYTAVNDFIDGPSGKLGQIGRDLTAVRAKGSARSSEDEKHYEALQALELELIELRDTLLQIAPVYHPNHDDGVQITAAPLWQLFRHKPWQKILKDTWAKLEKGDYDWAHLALAYWPDRVRKKCKADMSLAIAHDLEDLYVEPVNTAKKGRSAK